MFLCLLSIAKFTDAELKEKRQRALEMKQFLQDNKVHVIKCTFSMGKVF